jgi:hypothetical protein
MTRTTRQVMVGVMVTAGTVAATLFSGAKAFAAQSEQMTVVPHVSAYAHLSPSDLNGAEDEATRIYRTADIKAVRLASDPGPLMLTGHRIGAYQVQALLGAGGMGEVYRARVDRGSTC